MTAVFSEGHREELSTFGLGFCINLNQYMKLKTKLELVSCLFKRPTFNYMKLKTKLELVSCLFKRPTFNYIVESLINNIIKLIFD
jgi:hypothetical protein